jgi:hypothetical protein
MHFEVEAVKGIAKTIMAVPRDTPADGLRLRSNHRS